MVMEFLVVGILDECNVEVLGIDLMVIKKVEDCEVFWDLMNELGELVLESDIIYNLDEVYIFVECIGYLVIVCLVYMFGGFGGGICYNE